MMVCTPDAHLREEDAFANTSNEVHKMNDEASRISDYFRSKKSRFEFQFQFKLKKFPEGTVYFGLEFDNPIKMGIIQRSVASAALVFVGVTNHGFHYSLTGGVKQQGHYQLPHLVFPLVGCMERLVAKNERETTPQLGEAFYENWESMTKRGRGKNGYFPGWSMDYTYTIR